MPYIETLSAVRDYPAGMERKISGKDQTEIASSVSGSRNASAGLQPFSSAVPELRIILDPAVAAELPDSFCSRLGNKLVAVRNFIQYWAPNHLILQIGPQVKLPLTGTDFKFTTTLVLSAAGIEIYPIHTEIGIGVRTGSPYINGYGLLVKQFGAQFSWSCGGFSYNRQQLGRLELDIPYGSSDMQFTMAIELGITDKTRSLLRSLQHALQDMSTILPAKGLLLNQAYHQAGIIGPVIGLLATPAVMDSLIERALPGGSERESSLWFGFSFGYLDYNGTLYPDLNQFGDPSFPGVNIQTNAYLRRGEALSYDYQTQKVTLPPATRWLFGRYYTTVSAFLNDALKARNIISQELREKKNNGDITAQQQEQVLNIVDDIVSSLSVSLRNDSESLNVVMDIINNNFDFSDYISTTDSERVENASDINAMPVEVLAHKIACQKQCYVILDDEGNGWDNQNPIRIFNHQGLLGEFANIGKIAVDKNVVIICPSRIDEFTAEFDLISYPLPAGHNHCDILAAMQLSPEQLLAERDTLH
ncbi:hypothetical protein [Pantoea sp. B65]|uniref:hypothetical protein n=1 Tax=Pantoea sp. B65 TaxID=2813359 RepID=UPI0039B60696